MAKRSVVDDLTARDLMHGHGGYSILFENPEIRRMLRLAGAGPSDVFCDLGCGLAQNLIIAASEFRVKHALGFELNEKRFKKAKKRITLKGLDDRCGVFRESFEKVLAGKSKNFNLADATIVFYGLETDKELFTDLESNLSENCRLIYYNLCLFPEIMPNRVDYPFFMSVFPFRKTRSELKWLQKVVDGKQKSLIHPGKKPSIDELWDELRHDFRIKSDDKYSIRDYKNRIRALKLRL